MKKVLRPRDILLLFLAGGLDAFIEFKNEPMATACKNLYGWVPPRYRKTNYFQTVYHSLRTGYVERVVEKGEVCLRLTAKGSQRLKRHFSLSGQQEKKWDRKWRLVIFDIAEVNKKTRENLRAKLRELGFGMLQKSVWVSPYDFLADLREFMASLGLRENTFVFETSSRLASDNKVLAAKIWPLESINEEYEELLSLLTNLSDRVKNSIEELRKARSQYLEILRKDPCLPRELLPKVWYRDKVEASLRKLK